MAFELGPPIFEKLISTGSAAVWDNGNENGRSIANGANNGMAGLIVRGSFLVG